MGSEKGEDQGDGQWYPKATRKRWFAKGNIRRGRERGGRVFRKIKWKLDRTPFSCKEGLGVKGKTSVAS